MRDIMMLVFSKILQTTIPVLYGASALCYLCYFFRKNIGLKRLATLTLTISAVTHFGHTIALGIIAGRHPMATIFEFLSFVAMTMSFIYLFMEIWHRNACIGAFVVPAIFVLQLISALGIAPAATLTPPLLQEMHFALHATAFAAAYAAFFMGVMFALMVILFERSIKQHRFGIVFEQLPSLSILARMTAGTLLLGFVLMSIGLGFGAWTAMNASAGDVALDAKILLTLLVWLLYGFAIFSRFILRWSEKSTALFSIAGFILLVLTTLISHITMLSWHNFVG